MGPALAPEEALAYLRALSTDLREGVVLGSRGERLAGPGPLEAPVRRLLAAAPASSGPAGPALSGLPAPALSELPAPAFSELAVRAAGGWVFAARSETHAVVLACGPHALASVVALDLRAALAGLGAAIPPSASFPEEVAGPPRPVGSGALAPLAAAVLAAADGVAAVG